MTIDEGGRSVACWLHTDAPDVTVPVELSRHVSRDVSALANQPRSEQL